MTENIIRNYTIAFFICFFLFLNSCGVNQQIINNQPIALKTGGLECQQDEDCLSGVCNFTKQAKGQCMAAQCSTSDQAIGINGDTTFYCDHNNQWQKVKQVGESCIEDYECVHITCKDTPSCHPGDFKYYCQNNKCASEQQPDPCAQLGLVRITQKDEYFNLEKCMETFAQREIQTVCAPCGNNICDLGLENQCNCPVDCPKLFSLEEIAKHKSKDDCWLLINEKVYDVTFFVNSHPGGKAILQGCGQEATQLFETRPMGSGTPHSSNARTKMQNYYLGELKIN